MNFAVIGLGSMGKRRIRLLKKIDPRCQIVGMDSNKKRGLEVAKLFNLKAFYSDFDTLIKKEKLDGVIVCSSPLTHKDYVVSALKKGFNTFSEINLVDEGYEEIIQLTKEKKLVAFLSSTFLYRKEIKWIKKNVNPKQSFYRYHTGQYLPDWHPWESYKDFFVNNRKTNGCREIMAIEFPWLLNVFGMVDDFKVFKSKKTTLDLNYPDVFQILFSHRSGATGAITIDLVSRKAERALQVFSEGGQVDWNGSPENLFSYDINTKKMDKIELYDTVNREKNYSDSIVENAYEDELFAFLESIEKRKNKGLYTYEKDQEVLRLIDSLEGNANE